jgi:hypothetical protein
MISANIEVIYVILYVVLYQYSCKRDSREWMEDFLTYNLPQRED